MICIVRKRNDIVKSGCISNIVIPHVKMCIGNMLANKEQFYNWFVSCNNLTSVDISIVLVHYIGCACTL